METYDAEKAAQVWKRVQGSSPETPDAATLCDMIAGEQNDAAVYLQLSRRYQGRESALLRRLFEEEMSHTACLKGIYTLLTGQKLPARSHQPSQDPTETILRRCYGREMRCLALYEQWSGHPEFGPVFRRLAQQEQEHCRTLLVLLGMLNK